MRSKAYCIKVAPIAWQKGVRNTSRFYDNQARDLVSFGLYLSQQHNDEPLFDKPLHLETIFYMPIHKSAKYKPKSPYHVVNPGIENLLKFLIESISEVVIKDRSVICSFSAKKVYDKEPRTELIITEV